ncbi:carboxymuconolactone decarboxylase family protein [Marinomonas mediterranea]|jgi:Uncharacterized homolog of gamma-carboxymuconolactone decarboxylase subunit|uniref:Carboxymuconolactone decarboxylase n=1 Tax=Marinomonas mediterranea (strain ATCC 700492 / JCM 21426 / NBRC 103028 / MMB-1) TaxID=717774 RepID=F2JUJ4_MARM1|nr:carboxymuconolactone decarboxylase family protein [Marinomonas mediterranea]ADZ89327.1 Carboxymuconolactone decarboxylase [Marinomonas mediterranea MMB-1]WCN11526.1 carboxymuconolactone decarboxylase family protein [Marinomonas mediterranea]WCN15594.1 carboxymuconolactone decarboxylase family protein [Marinomonas mediterranea MMB-1]
MTTRDTHSPAQTAFGDIASEFANLTDDILFNQVWKGQTLSSRQRSLITVSALVAMNRGEQLPFHLHRAIENGVSIEELSAVITHLAFYSGWPCAASAFERLKDVKIAQEQK